MANPYPSTATKGQLLDLIFEECGIAGYEFDREPGEDVSALRRVDAMMGEWAAQGCNLNYNFPVIFGQSLPTDLVGIPDSALNAVALWGAMRFAPTMGKSLSAETRKSMADAKSMWFAETASIPSMHFPHTTPRGIGNKPYSIWRPFMGRYCKGQLELPDLVLSDATAQTGVDYAATLGPITQGVQLQLISDVGGKYALTGNLLRGTGLTTGTDNPVVRQIFPGAKQTIHDTALTVTVS